MQKNKCVKISLTIRYKKIVFLLGFVRDPGDIVFSKVFNLVIYLRKAGKNRHNYKDTINFFTEKTTNLFLRNL